MLNPTPNLDEQCLMVTEAMNALAPGINKILFIREITPEDELLYDELVFQSDAAYQTYLTMLNDMNYYKSKRDACVARQNFELATDYLDKFKKKKMILHRAIQTLSFKSGKPYAATKGATIVYFNPRVQG